VYGEAFNGFGVVGSGGLYGVYGYSSNGFAVFAESSGGPFAPQITALQENTNDLCRFRMGISGSPQWHIAITPGATPQMNFFNGTTNVVVMDYAGNVTAESYLARSTGGAAAPQLALLQQTTNGLSRLRMGVSGSTNWDIQVSSGAAPQMSFFNGFSNAVFIDFAGNVTAKSFITTSDRAAKEQFAEVDAREVLARVAQLPIQTWKFKDDSATRHIGPMAQDFHAAFGVGPDDKHIATVDADGVALAAIQGLSQVVKEKDARISAFPALRASGR